MSSVKTGSDRALSNPPNAVQMLCNWTGRALD
jgi:hypothetical protein